MIRKGIIIEDPLTEEEIEKIWLERLNQTKDAVREANKFIKVHDLRNKDILFLGALIKILDDILEKKGG